MEMAQHSWSPHEDNSLFFSGESFKAHSALRMDIKSHNPRNAHSIAPYMAIQWEAKKKQNTEPTLTKWEKYGNGTSTSVLKTNWWSFSESEWNESVYSEERWFRGGLEGMLIGHRSNDFWHLFYYKVSKLLSAELTNVLVTVVFEKHSEC